MVHSRYNKYKAHKTVVDGIQFDSKKEARRYTELTLMEASGAISNLQRQVKFILIPQQRAKDEVTITKTGAKRTVKGKVLERECTYTADFTYFQDGKYIVEDTKGMRTDVYKIKRKLMLYVHGIQIKEV